MPTEVKHTQNSDPSVIDGATARQILKEKFLEASLLQINWWLSCLNPVESEQSSSEEPPSLINQINLISIGKIIYRINILKGLMLKL